MGSVEKRGKIYYVRYAVPGPDGKRRQKAESCPGMNKKEAETYLQEICRKIRYGTFVENGESTVGEYFDQWLKRMEPNLSPTSLQGYRQVCEKHIYPSIGRYKLTALRPIHIQGIYDRMGDTYAAKTIKCLHGVIHGALDQAVRLRIIASNPADGLVLPKVRRAEISTASDEDIAKLLLAIEDTRYKIPILIAIGTGMRRCEVLGLKWEDYDAERKIFMVHRNRVQVVGRVVEKGTKTDRPRAVLVPEYLQGKLAAHREEQKQMHGRCDGWICTDEMGEPLTPTALGHGYRRIRSSVGVDVTFHGLRHTQITEMLMKGIPVKVASERAGHSSSSITQDRYGHVLPTIQHQAVVVIDNMLGRAQKIAVKIAKEGGDVTSPVY